MNTNGTKEVIIVKSKPEKLTRKEVFCPYQRQGGKCGECEACWSDKVEVVYIEQP